MTTREDRRKIFAAVVENSALTVIGSKEKTLFFGTDEGEVVEISVDVEQMNPRQILDAALDLK